MAARAACSLSGSTAPAATQLDSWIAIAADGTRHGVHRQVRARPRALHGADATGRRRARCAAQSRPADSVRHRDDARSGHDLRAASRTRPTSTTANLALAGATAREALFRLAADAARRPDRSARSPATAWSASKTEPLEERGLRRAGRRKEVPSRSIRAAKRKTPARVDGARHAGAARRHARQWSTGRFEFVHNVRVPGMLHGRVVRPPAVGATRRERRRELGPRHAGRGEGRGQEELRRRGRREAVAGDADRREAAGDVDARAPACRRSATSTSSCGQQPSARRASGELEAMWTRRSRAQRRSSRRPIATRIRCTARSARHAPSPTCRATRRRSGRRPSRSIPTRNTRGDALGLRPENVRVIFTRGVGLLRHQRRRHRLRYERPLLSQAVGKPVRVQLSRKDEMAWENYGNAVRDRSARRPRRRRHDRRVGLRGVVAGARAAGPGYNTPGQRRHRHAGRVRAGAVQRRARRRRRRRASLNNSQRGAVVHRRPRAATSRTAPERCAASACSRISVRSPFFTGPLRVAGAAAEHVRARMRSWTKSPRR